MSVWEGDRDPSSLPVSESTAYFSSFTIPDPSASRAACTALFRSHINSSSTATQKGLLRFHLQVPSPTSLGWILLLSLLTVACAEINRLYSWMLSCVYEMVLQEQIYWSLFKGFLHEQRCNEWCNSCNGTAVCDCLCVWSLASSGTYKVLQ